jgi:hypothetical protein
MDGVVEVGATTVFPCHDVMDIGEGLGATGREATVVVDPDGDGGVKQTALWATRLTFRTYSFSSSPCD